MRYFLTAFLFLAGTDAATAEQELTPREYFYHSTEPGSLYYWHHGRGPGSLHFWRYGKRRGSEYFWLHSRAPLSRYYWFQGKGRGSEYYWYRGRSDWSEYHWLYSRTGMSEYAFYNQAAAGLDAVPVVACLGASLDIAMCRLLRSWANEHPGVSR